MVDAQKKYRSAKIPMPVKEANQQTRADDTLNDHKTIKTKVMSYLIELKQKNTVTAIIPLHETCERIWEREYKKT